MKTKAFINEITISLVLIVLLILCLNPFEFYMPSRMVMMLLVLIIAVFGLFAALVWREKPRDERESLLRMFAGRTAFLTGCTILVIGIIVQELNHTSDPWLVIALVGMILGKMIGFLYEQNRS